MAGEALRQPVSATQAEKEAGKNDDGLSTFEPLRARLFGIAYRMLGSAAEAEDVVQDVWLRWQSIDRSSVENPPAFLATTTTRLCLNLAQSAKMRRESCVGTWVAEPVDTGSDPTIGAERGEALKQAVQLLLEKLSPTERAAYVLREAFEYPYREIAEILQLEEANVRQLVSRGRKHIAEGRRTPVSSAGQRRLLEAFVAAAQQGNMAALEGLLTEDVVSYSDNGGYARAAGVSVSGRNQVAEFVASISTYSWEGVTIEWMEINGRTSVLVSRDGVPVMLGRIDATSLGIDQILWFLSPTKLAELAKSKQTSGDDSANNTRVA